MRWLVSLWNLVWCKHFWLYLDIVEDQDLRSGCRFWSERYTCKHCGRTRTHERRDLPRT